MSEYETIHPKLQKFPKKAKILKNREIFFPRRKITTTKEKSHSMMDNSHKGWKITRKYLSVN